jgi:hypothetical protein
MKKFKQYIREFNAMKTRIMIAYIMTSYSQVGGTGIRRNNVLLISSRLKWKLLQDIRPKRRQALTRLHGAAEQENKICIKETGILTHGDIINCVYVYM